MVVMRFIRRSLIFTVFAVALAQVVAPVGLPIRAAAKDYDVSGVVGAISIGATYMGRTFSAQHGEKLQMHDAGNFVVVEVGVFATKDYKDGIAASDFRLIVDGKKATLSATPGGVVANALRNRDMDPERPRLVMGAGINQAGVTMGQPRQKPQFPGDPRPGQSQPIGTAKATEGDARDWDAAPESALVEGPLASGRAGNLFFAYPGKMSKVKSLILQYDGAAGRLDLKLR